MLKIKLYETMEKKKLDPSLIYCVKLLKFKTSFSEYSGGSIDKREDFFQRSGGLLFHEPRMSRTGHDMRNKMNMDIETFYRNLP